MKIAALIVRILLGLIFIVFGLNGFLHFIPQPPMPPSDALTFFTVMIKSHYMMPIFAIQVIGGALLLAGLYVPLGLALLAPVIVNIFLTHLLLAPSGLPLAIITALLWLVLFYAYREYFASIFTANAKPA